MPANITFKHFRPLSTNARPKIQTRIRFSVLLYRYGTVPLETLQGCRLCAVERSGFKMKDVTESG